jgi:AcrR family transcriptional regulator
VTRRRRSSDEVRALLLAAAVEVFGERGFSGATTKAISERAGVSETLLFRHYGDKAQLFEAAVIQPIQGFLRTYTDRWLSAPLDESDPEEMIRSFVEGLYDLARDHRSLLVAAAASHLAASATGAFDRLELMAAETARVHGYEYDPAIAIRIAIAAVVSVSLFEDDLFPAAGRPARERIVDELTGVLLRGLTRVS